MDDVTVVVATRNRRAELERSLPRHEPSVIVVDNASTDDIADVVLRHRDTGLIRLPDNRGAAARTVGALAATTPFVAFADDDSWWAPGALAEGAELMRRHPEVALLNARIVVGAEQRPDPVCGTMARSPLDSSGDGAEIGPRILGFVACATLVRRDAFLRVGGFDDVIRFPGEEERVAIDLAAAGWELRYAPELVVHHHPGPGRDRAGRQRAIVRSRILTAVMRRSWMCVMSRVGIAWHAGGPSRDGAHAALRDARRALRERQAIPRSLEADLRLLEAGAGP
jgi:GT2 family glycosyltransferase